MCVDVYVDNLPAAKRLFVCKRRIVRGMAQSIVEVHRKALHPEPRAKPSIPRTNGPGISGQRGGRLWTLTISRTTTHTSSSSSIDEDGRLLSKYFGSQDFFGQSIAKRADGTREGCFAFREASMTVPAATGPPVDIVHHNTQTATGCFPRYLVSEVVSFTIIPSASASDVKVACIRT
jgi:hypothetical protein